MILIFRVAEVTFPYIFDVKMLIVANIFKDFHHHHLYCTSDPRSLFMYPVGQPSDLSSLLIFPDTRSSIPTLLLLKKLLKVVIVCRSPLTA